MILQFSLHGAFSYLSFGKQATRRATSPNTKLSVHQHVSVVTFPSKKKTWENSSDEKYEKWKIHKNEESSYDEKQIDQNDECEKKHTYFCF